MNDNLQNTLADLAKKLGTTADQLWPVMMKQVQMDAAWSALSDLILFSIFLLLVGFSVFMWWKKDKENKTDQEDKYYRRSSSTMNIWTVFIVIFSVFAAISGCVLFSGSIPDYYKCKANPEYYAAQEMRRLISR